MDQESLLACAAYVELNPIRAALSETLESSDYTSVQRRIQSEFQTKGRVLTASVRSLKNSGVPQASRAAATPSPVERRDAFLAKLTIDEAKDPIGVVAGQTGLNTQRDPTGLETAGAQGIIVVRTGHEF